MDKEDQKTKKNQKGTEHRKQISEVPLPYCTIAPSPEHARASSEDEPCDDGRAGGSNAPDRGDEINESEEFNEDETKGA